MGGRDAQLHADVCVGLDVLDADTEARLPALEVVEVVLAAVASAPTARRRFAELAQRVPASTPGGS